MEFTIPPNTGAADQLLTLKISSPLGQITRTLKFVSLEVAVLFGFGNQTLSAASPLGLNVLLFD
jgi:hypothetical protein